MGKSLNGTFRYKPSGHWYKGNAHIHSTASDGGKTFAELATMYAAAGYDFLFRTDHWVTSDVSADPARYELLWLDGVELDGRDEAGSYYHVVCLGAESGLSAAHRDMPFQEALEQARADGALLILAHPHWLGTTFEEALRHGFDGVEVYNHVCRWLNGKGDGHAYWSAMLRRDPSALALAVDDAHLSTHHPGWNGGWIVAQADALSREAILQSLRAGSFYASTGPDFHAIHWDGARVSIETSPVQFVRLVGPGSLGQRIGDFNGARLTAAAFEVPVDWPYVYLEIEDEHGGRAWSNTLFAP